MFVLMNPETKRIVARYPSERGAKIARTRKFKGQNLEVMALAVYDVGFRTMVPTVNLMSGETIMIDVNDKGTCVDPGTETYWSM